MRKKLVFVSDMIFIMFISFILFFILINFYLDKPYSIIISLSLSVIIMLFYEEKQKGKLQREVLRKKEEKEINYMTNQLNVFSKEEQIDFLLEALKRKNINGEKTKNYVLLKDKNICLFMGFSYENISKAHIVKVFNSVKKGFTSYIISSDFSTEIMDFSKRFMDKIQLIDKTAFYKFIKEVNIMPDEKVAEIKEKKFPDGFFAQFFTRKKAKNYILFAFMFLMMSYFVPLKLYYIICGVIFLVFSLISLLFGREKNNI